MSTALYPIDNLVFTVTILDERSSYGHPEVLISPQSGSGSRWIRKRRLITSPPAAQEAP